jgi:hypothetical protein
LGLRFAAGFALGKLDCHHASAPAVDMCRSAQMLSDHAHALVVVARLRAGLPQIGVEPAF